MDIDHELQLIENDVSVIKGHLQQTALRRRNIEDEDVEVESPLFGFGRRPSFHPSSGGHSGLSGIEKLMHST